MKECIMKIGNSFNTQALNDLNNHKTNTDLVLSKIAAVPKGVRAKL
jgi:hypothetical protein